MAVVNLKSTAITNATATPRVPNSTTLEKGIVRRSIGLAVMAATDSAASTYRICRVPSSACLDRIMATTADIDRGMQLGCGHPMGPLTLLDFIGLDTAVRIAEIMFDEYREPRFAAPPLLRRMVVAGMHGRKSGRGFYDYSLDPPAPVALGL